MTAEKAGALIMATVKRKALTEISLGIILYLAIFTFSGAAASSAKNKYTSPECDSCRTVVEQFYKGWEKTVHGLAANGTFESRAGAAPKITYNQEIDDYLLGFCKSDYMKGFADYIDDGCRKFMAAHHRPMVGKFLHGEEKFSTTLSRSQKPERIRSVCTNLGKSCPDWPPPELSVKKPADKCAACQGVVMDGSYLLRRSRYGELPPSALKKKKLEVFEIMENLCLDTFTRHDDDPTSRHEICNQLWEEDEDAVIDIIMKHNDQKDDTAAVKALCVQKFDLCKSSDIAVSKAHEEL